jgi:hypothetical protein
MRSYWVVTECVGALIARRRVASSVRVAPGLGWDGVQVLKGHAGDVMFENVEKVERTQCRSEKW